MDAYTYRSVDLDILTEDQQKVLEYWESIKGDRFAPSWQEFDLMKIPHRLLPFTHISDVIEAGKDFFFRFYGTNLAEIHCGELTGKTTLDIQPPLLANAVRNSFSAVLEAKAPVASIAEIDPQNLTTFQVVVRLPLSNDGLTVTGIATVAEYRRSVADARQVIEEIIQAEKKSTASES